MSKFNKLAQKILSEIDAVVSPKLFNINNGTATDMEKQIVQECLGFVSLIKYSALDIREINRVWENTNLKFM